MLQFFYKITVLWLLSIIVIIPLAWSGDISPNKWPQEIKTKQGTVVIYQPEPESLKDNQLKARAAVALEPNNSKEPIFGVIWFNARLETDRAERTATILDVKVDNIRFPKSVNDKQKQLTDLLEREIPKWHLVISLDQLLATLGIIEQQQKSAEKINNTPPEIIFMSEPAVLITIDGKPVLQDIKNTELQRVLNTPFTILLDPKTKIYYLNADAKVWYTSKDIMQNWVITNTVPPVVAALAPEEKSDNTQQSKQEKIKPGPPPKIVVRTKPAELISATGKPKFKPIKDTSLLYMSNTESDVLMSIEKQKYYILLAGRWYISKKIEGPWKYVPGTELPKDFAKIPEDSDMGTVLYAVPGTDMAKEAVLDLQIPQTASINRSKAKLTVKYDGKPVFKEIKKTSLDYAANTATPVIKVSAKEYYAVDEAVWFKASNATGPWKIATSVPGVIYTIPPDSSMYHVTFVKIYKVEPEVIYVGYTPGYTHTYVYHNTIVYGTGYYYPGWYGYYYYPPPVTWGYHVRYNPYYGWHFGLSYSSGPFTFVIGGGGWYHGSWWGPARYRGYNHGYHHGYRNGARAGFRAGYNAGKARPLNQNMYRSPKNKVRAKPANRTPPQSKIKPATNRQNNVFSDRQGNVHRKTNNGWQQQNPNGGWKTSPKTRPGTNKPVQQPTRQPGTQPRYNNNQQQLNQSYQSRQRGSYRSQSYNQTRNAGGRRGGGGRRR